jgi:hypothetical protein
VFWSARGRGFSAAGTSKNSFFKQQRREGRKEKAGFDFHNDLLFLTK